MVASLRMNCSKRSHNWTKMTLQRELGQAGRGGDGVPTRYPTPGNYIFKHALIQDAAYASLLKSTRQQYHQRIAQVLEAQFPETLKHSPNCWRITTRRQVSPRRRCTIGITRVNEPASGQPMWKPSRHSGKGWRYSRRCPRPLSVTQREVDMHIALGRIADCHQRLCGS